MPRFRALSAPILFLLVLIGLFPFASAQAGNCVAICRTLAERQNGSVMLVLGTGGTCTNATQCSGTTAARCPAGSVAAPEQAAAFCRIMADPIAAASTYSTAEIQSATWCGDFRNGTIVSNVCRLARVTVPRTPAPAPARPGEAFRCRFLCRGEPAHRDGAVCASATDSASCITQCNSACGSADNCAGLTPTGTIDDDYADQAPTCLATSVAPSAGGLVDSGQFEAVNESFTNISVPNFIGNLIKALLGISGALFFSMLVWGGVRWMTASGDPGSVQAAQKITKNAIVGVILIVLAYTVVSAFMQIVVQVTSPAS